MGIVLKSLVALLLLLGALPLQGDATSSDVAWRDPFWPVGYAPKVVEPEPEPEPEPELPPLPEPVKAAVKQPTKPQPDWRRARAALRISGFAEADGKRICFINGRLVNEGDTVVLPYNGFRYTWRVRRIDVDPAQREFDELTVEPLERGKQ